MSMRSATHSQVSATRTVAVRGHLRKQTARAMRHTITIIRPKMTAVPWKGRSFETTLE